MKIKCAVCKKEFIVSASDYNKGQRCCSKNCSKILHGRSSKLKTFKCKVCGKEFKGRQSKDHPFKYCSRECYYKARRLAHKDFDEANFDNNGYRIIYINGYPVREHDYLMEQVIGRKLNKDEVVHHINFDRKDNRIENLQLMNKSDHIGLHAKIRSKKYSITINGETHCLKDWSRISGIKYQTILSRHRHNWPNKDLLISTHQPVKGENGKFKRVIEKEDK